MNKSELINAVAEKGLAKKDAGAAVKAVFECLTQALAKGEKVQIVGFGTFEVRERAAKEAINPKTREKIHVPAAKAPVFKAGQALKNAVK